MHGDPLSLLTGEIQDVPAVIVAAHPDDEVIGAGSRLPLLPQLTVVHVTDGAPRNMYDAQRHGFQTREDYAAARRAEFAGALQVADISPRCVEIGIPDQEATAEVERVAQELTSVFREIRPAFVLTHAYEGGHPDHDATALAVHLAADGIPIVEFTSYHNSDGGIRTGDFLPGPQPVLQVTLNARQQNMKRAMLDCFRTQAETLAPFGVDAERFRLAACYDFTQPPHGGPLYYERFNWGMTGERFRAAASGLRIAC